MEGEYGLRLIRASFIVIMVEPLGGCLIEGCLLVNHGYRLPDRASRLAYMLELVGAFTNYATGGMSCSAATNPLSRVTRLTEGLDPVQHI